MAVIGHESHFSFDFSAHSQLRNAANQKQDWFEIKLVRESVSGNLPY